MSLAEIVVANATPDVIALNQGILDQVHSFYMNAMGWMVAMMAFVGTVAIALIPYLLERRRSEERKRELEEQKKRYEASELDLKNLVKTEMNNARSRLDDVVEDQNDKLSRLHKFVNTLRERADAIERRLMHDIMIGPGGGKSTAIHLIRLLGQGVIYDALVKADDSTSEQAALTAIHFLTSLDMMLGAPEHMDDAYKRSVGEELLKNAVNISIENIVKHPSVTAAMSGRQLECIQLYRLVSTVKKIIADVGPEDSNQGR